MAWIFRIHDLFGRFDYALPGTPTIDQIVITGGKRFSGKAGERIILLSSRNKKWLFTHTGTILNIEERKSNFQDKFDSIINYRVNATLSPPNNLEDFSYSLLRIKRFDDPIQHFSRLQYAKISEIEFEAIANGEIFIARTVFGKLINSLHLEHRRNFLRILLSNKPVIIFENVDYVNLYYELKNYLEENIFTPIQWLRSTYYMLNTIVEKDQLFSIGFRDNSLSGKADIISEYPFIRFNATNEMDDILALRSYFYESITFDALISTSLQRGLNDLFKNTPLPITV
jgi:hypothetical protein